jgi:hypothetical protein
MENIVWIERSRMVSDLIDLASSSGGDVIQDLLGVIKRSLDFYFHNRF